MSPHRKDGTPLARRDFLKHSVMAAGTIGAINSANAAAAEPAAQAARSQQRTPESEEQRAFNSAYRGSYNEHIAFPLGGMGAGMICLEGTGYLSHISVRNRPEIFHEPCIFAAICIKRPGKGNIARVLEGQVRARRIFGMRGTGTGAGGRAFGLPRFDEAEFQARFPFGEVKLSDDQVPLQARIIGWSPFVPNDADHASMPMIGLEYEFTNPTSESLDCVFSFNSGNFIHAHGAAVRSTPGGFILHVDGAPDRPWEQGDFCIRCTDPQTKVNCVWFRGGWFDSLTIAWQEVIEGKCYERAPVTEGPASPGASLFVPFSLAAGETKKITLQLCWYVGKTNLRFGEDPKVEGQPAPAPTFYQPWYSKRFKDIHAVANYWAPYYDELRLKTKRFSDAFYDSTLPPEVIEAVAANLTILKSPTVLRQHDGKLWAWEGCGDDFGSCHGSCTHVWNYAQALSHLFPAMERTLRDTEFEVSQNEEGRQCFRSSLPIRTPVFNFHSATDGQLGGIMKVHREWQTSADDAWLSKLWPKVKLSLEYCIKTWDPKRKGYLEEPQHNTYDIEFWGPTGMLNSFYLGALSAGVAMGKALGDEQPEWAALRDKCRAFMEKELYNGEYFIQKIQWQGLQAPDPTKLQSFAGDYSPEARELLKREGPKYQYGNGCLSDGVLGAWMAEVCGVGPVLDAGKVKSHLAAVHKYNLKVDLIECGHANPQRPSFACGREGGLLLCSWPHGDQLSLPFVYSNEVWTGIEYQAAAHMIMMGLVEEGLEVVRVCRARYDGRIRNPFNEYECGHWYARAMSSYALLQALSGARYDLINKRMTLHPRIAGDFRAFISTATGYGTVGVRDGKPFVEAKAGSIEVKEWDYHAAS